MQGMRQPVSQRAQHLQPRVILVVAFDQGPGRVPGACGGDHVVHRLLVRLPLLAIAPVLVGQLPALVRQTLALLEAPQLFVLGDVHPVLHQDDAMGHQLRFEVVDLGVGPLPLGVGGEAFDALHQDAAVPRAVEDREPPGPGQWRQKRHR